MGKNDNLSDLEIQMHNIRVAGFMSDDMSKRNSVLLFGVSIDKNKELNVVAGIDDKFVIEVMETLIKGMKSGMRIQSFK